MKHYIYFLYSIILIYYFYPPVKKKQFYQITILLSSDYIFISWNSNRLILKHLSNLFFVKLFPLQPFLALSQHDNDQILTIR